MFALIALQGTSEPTCKKTFQEVLQGSDSASYIFIIVFVEYFEQFLLAFSLEFLDFVLHVCKKQSVSPSLPFVTLSRTR